jgi:SET domain-containing protein
MAKENNMSNYKAQEVELNMYVKTCLAPSDIHGVGVFALRTIPKGQKLYTDMVPKLYNLPYKSFKNLFPEIQKQLLGQFPQIVNGSAFAYPTTRIQAWINHSEDPNYDAVNDVALKTIRKGQEITEDYRKIEGYEKVFDFIKD